MKYDVYGIGNALLDIQYDVGHDFLSANNLPKGLMSYVEHKRQDDIIDLEIKEIITKLESTETNLEDSMERYNRMMHLNNHIQDKFRMKANEIKKSLVVKKKEIINNN